MNVVIRSWIFIFAPFRIDRRLFRQHSPDWRRWPHPVGRSCSRSTMSAGHHGHGASQANKWADRDGKTIPAQAPPDPPGAVIVVGGGIPGTSKCGREIQTRALLPGTRGGIVIT